MVGFLMVVMMCPMKKAEAKQIIEVVVDKKVKDIDRELARALDMARYNTNNNITYKVIIPKGTYRLKSNLNIYSNTWLVMDGVTLIREFSGCLMRFGRGSEVSNAKGYSAFRNITIEGGTLDGNGQAKKYSTSLLRFAHSQNVTVKNVTFTNMWNGHHMEFSASKDVLIENCTFKDYRGSRTGNREALQIEINHKKHFGEFGKFDETPCRDITVRGCTFKNLHRGLGTHAGIVGSYFNNIVIEDNTFKDIDGYAIVAANWINSKISNNKIEDAGSGIFYRHMIGGTYYPSKKGGKGKALKNCRTEISNNKIEVVDKNYEREAIGVFIYGAKYNRTTYGTPKGDYRVYKVRVRNNQVTMKNNGYGMQLEGAMSSTVSGNTINMATTKKARGKASGVGILVFSGTKNRIENNTIRNTSKHRNRKKFYGIRFDGKQSGTTRKNKITGFTKEFRLSTRKWR